MGMPGHALAITTRLTKFSGQLHGAEIGVASGVMSSGLLSGAKNLNLVMIDTWASYPPDHPYYKSGDLMARQSTKRMAELMALAESRTNFAADRRTMLRLDSVEAAQRFADGFFHFAFIDADHTYEAVLRDINAWWPKVMPGGFMAGHDYGHRRDRVGIWGVTKAVNEFATKNVLSVDIVGSTVWLINKPERQS